MQNADGLFAKLSYGETIFCGQSVRQREMIVSRIITISIIVEGIHLLLAVLVHSNIKSMRINNIASGAMDII